MAPNQSLQMKLKTSQRLAILGRLRMADWIEMPEKEFSRKIEEIEKDPLFQKLFFGNNQLPGAIRRQKWPAGRMSSSFFEASELVAGKGERVQVEEKLGEKTHLLPLIRKMGQKNFERYFLHADDALPLDEIARKTGLTHEEALGIHELLLEIGAQSEFYLPNREPELQKSYACLARINMTDDEPSFEFYSPYWARGLYQIRYDLLEDWKQSQMLTGPERRRLRHLAKRIETINLRQNTLYRIMESIVKLQKEYLRTRNSTLLRPISLRMLAQRLQLAPSTVSRAISIRSIQMPWGKEAPISALLPGQRHVVRDVMSLWLEEKDHRSDSSLAQRLKQEYGIDVSRRTVNAVRNEILKAH